MQPKVVWLVLRGLGLVLLLTLLLLRVATPRTYVTPGDHVNPAGVVKSGKDAAPAPTKDAGHLGAARQGMD